MITTLVKEVSALVTLVKLLSIAHREEAADAAADYIGQINACLKRISEIVNGQ